MLMIFLFGPPLTALFLVGKRGYTGMEVTKPFVQAGSVAFVVSGILLIATLLGGDMAVNYLLLGTAAFGGAISCGVTALVVWLREQRKMADRQRAERPWPPEEDL